MLIKFFNAAKSAETILSLCGMLGFGFFWTWLTKQTSWILAMIGDPGPLGWGLIVFFSGWLSMMLIKFMRFMPIVSKTRQDTFRADVLVTATQHVPLDGSSGLCLGFNVQANQRMADAKFRVSVYQESSGWLFYDNANQWSGTLEAGAIEQIYPLDLDVVGNSLGFNTPSGNKVLKDDDGLVFSLSISSPSHPARFWKYRATRQRSAVNGLAVSQFKSGEILLSEGVFEP